MQKISYVSVSILLGMFVLASSCNKKDSANKPPEFITDSTELLQPVVKTREDYLREIRDYIELEYSGGIFDKKQRELWEEETGSETSLYAVHGEKGKVVTRKYSINEKKSADDKDVVEISYEVLRIMDLATRFKPDPRVFKYEFSISRGAEISQYPNHLYVSRDYIEKKLKNNVDDEGELDYESKISLEDINKANFAFNKITLKPKQRQKILDKIFGKKIDVRSLYKIKNIISKAREDKNFDIQTQDIALYEFLEKYTHSSNLEKLKQAFVERNGEVLSDADKKNIEIIDSLLEWVRSREMAG